MKKIDRYLKRKKIFLTTFLSSVAVCAVFTVLASSFIFKEGAETLREEDFVVGYVYEDNGADSYDNAVAVTKGKTSDGIKAENGALTITYDGVSSYRDGDAVATGTVEEKTFVFTGESNVAQEISTYTVTFIDEDGSVLMESVFGAGDTLVFPYLSSDKATKMVDGVTYTASWGETSATVNADATYFLSYVILAD